MVAPGTRADEVVLAVRTPTEHLLRRDSALLSPVMVYKLTAEGFEIKHVQDMISISDLYTAEKILSRIVGKSTRAIQRQSKGNQAVRLSSLQSAVAFQYATVLERATKVFGTQKLAEHWLGRPCGYFDGQIPLDVVGNPVGFQVVSDYLERIEYGVYQ
ncbi:antitoxin Xre/MbcA/ParS toxin-binding domain-containing protein [Stutzerimonas kunmingensis]|uniref:antitoxin Xre/MbcA/ParS toxin-binding domain-containing protein n=1 Tax=Stutzerimonas kunmingensis TaxID=1211807 RepID=UPI003AB740AF